MSLWRRHETEDDAAHAALLRQAHGGTAAQGRADNTRNPYDAYAPQGVQGARAGGLQTPQLSSPPSWDIHDDPFMTHNSEMRNVYSSASSDVRFDPFLNEARTGVPGYSSDLRSDPFLSKVRAGDSRSGRGTGSGSSWRGLRSEGGLKLLEKIEVFMDPDRKQWVGHLLMFAPWLVAIWVMFMWFVLRHYSETTAWTLTFLLLGACLLVSCSELINPVKRPVPMVSLGLLCAVGVLCGWYAGDIGWNYVWRQFWWTQTGATIENVDAGTPAVSVQDAATLVFSSGGRIGLDGTTSVAVDRAAGFKAGDMYCVAPVLNMDSVATGLARVNFWAIGLNCCDNYGGFSCDDARTWNAGYGVVMLNHTMICPDCDMSHFMSAVRKAELMHGLTSARGALYVRWVAETSTVTGSLALRAVGSVLLSSAVLLCLFVPLGWFFWAFGIGDKLSDGFTGLTRGPTVKTSLWRKNRAMQPLL